MIKIFKNAIPDEFCDYLIDKFDKCDEIEEGFTSYNDGKTEYESDKFLISADVHMSTHDHWIPDLIKLHEEYLAKVALEYLDNFKYIVYSETNFHLDNVIMSRYDKNRGFFAPHQDGAVLEYDRGITIISYLNDVTDGGETYFFNQECKVKPEKGSVAIFPSNFEYGHEGCVPKSNDKYLVVSFAKVSVGIEKDWIEQKGDEK